MTRTLHSTLASEIKLKRRDWGPWRLDAKIRVLYTDPTSHVGYRYEVDLDLCTSSAQVLDRVCQIADKVWGTAEQNAWTTAGLVNALNDVLHPQGSLCSSGQDKRLTKSDIRARVSRYGSTRPAGNA